MPDNVVNSRLVNAHHTASVWATISTVPKAGEICLETDTSKFKVGDGTHTYAELPYFNEGGTGSITTVEDGTSTGGLGSLKVTTDGVVTYPKAYGLGSMAGEDSSDYLQKSGGTMTGALTLNGAPSNDLHAATKKYVDDSVSALPTPMQFKGTVGSDGTIEWSVLPSAASSNEGFTYKVITDHATAPVCKTGDTIVSNGSAWIVIPSGDEPAGTVTNIATGAGLTGGPITSTGTIAHSNSVTAVTTETFSTFTYDNTGHITGSNPITIVDGNFS